MHPYRNQSPQTRWSKAVAEVEQSEVDPVIEFPFRINITDRVATAGSCFAQNIARHMKQAGYNYLVVEDGHPLSSPELKQEFNYGIYSARYGNIYTSRQMLQLLLRAANEFFPLEDYWEVEGGRFLDPLRPQIQPQGFASIEELHEDRRFHMRRVNYMIENMDVFIFTLGLTEAWYDLRDGTVFPVCPGVAGGEFSKERYAFVNLSVDQVVDDLKQAIARMRKINPAVKIILTVSPVPLAATARADQHVLSSTTYSKSVLRVAAEVVSNDCSGVSYFPSYEIITGSHTRQSYYGVDSRSITEDGVNHVMKVFFKHATENSNAPVPAAATTNTKSETYVEQMSRLAKVLCDEELIEKSLSEHD